MISRASGVLLIRGARTHEAFKQDACKYDATMVDTSSAFQNRASQMLQSPDAHFRSRFAFGLQQANGTPVASECVSMMPAPVQKFPLKKLQVVHALSPDTLILHSEFRGSSRMHGSSECLIMLNCDWQCRIAADRMTAFCANAEDLQVPPIKWA